MKKLSLSIGIGWILLLGTGTAVAEFEAKDGYDLFQQALLEESVEGDLEAAIERYRRIVEDHGDNRPLAATALIQIGQCWEKLGNAEAGKAYEQVLRDYADQLEQVATARSRLAALGGPLDTELSSTMVTRRIWAGPEVDLFGSLDRVGRYLTFVDWTTGDLAVRELATGKARRLTDKGPWSQSAEYAVESVVSPDGRRVTFGWVNEQQGYELRTVGIDGSQPQVLYANEEVSYVRPFQWSSDGTKILALFFRRDRTKQIVLVSAHDGSVRVVKTLDWRYPIGMSLSPDGRLIAYAFPGDENAQDHDVFVLAADGSRETPLVQHPADDVWPTWTATGKHVLFNSDRTGTMGIWAVEVADGLPVGTPKLIKSDIGHSQPLGVTAAGSYYYGIRGGMMDVYTAEIDVATGELLSPPAKAVERFTGSNHFPTWSPDGRYLAYISSRGGLPMGPEAAQLFISIRSLETGEEREFSLDLDRAPGGYPNFRWSPDGDAFLFNGIDAGNRVGLYRIDVKKGDVTAIVQEGSGFNFPGAVWSSDGRSVFYSYVDTDSHRSAIYTRALDSGAITKLSGQVFAPILSVSPDGRQLAFISGPLAPTDEKGIHLKIMPSGGGEARTLLTDTSIGMFLGDLAWTPDGQQLLFVKRAHFNEKELDPRQSIELWRISSEGGEPQRAGLALVGLNHFQLHPDGRRIAFTVATGGSEVWVMENFLAGLSASR